MNQRKTNNTLWYSLGLAVLLCAAFLVVSTGTTLARYRSEKKATVTFQVRAPAQIQLGTVRSLSEEEAAAAGVAAGTEVFDSSIQPKWMEVENQYQLNLAAANGTSETDFSEKDQILQLRVIGTLGLAAATETQAQAADLYLQIPSSTEASGYTTVKATATAIASDSTLYVTYGAGWIYTFEMTDENNQIEELSWTLPGGKFSYLAFTITMDSAALSSDSLLQPQIVANLVNE